MQPAPAKTINAGWVRLRAIGYLRGRGVSFGLNGPEPIYPQKAIDQGKYSLNFDIMPHDGVDACDQNLTVIAKGSLDHVFIGNRLSQYSDPENLIKECTDRLREGGHLIIHKLHGDQLQIESWLSAAGLWKRKDVYLRDEQFLGIYKLLGKQRRGVQEATPRSGKKRACIARYGAIGDMIMISPLIKQLHADGYEVTMNVTPYCAEALKNNPYVHNIILQERDAIPNPELGPYWTEWKDDYDKYINLSESIEGKLLKVEGRRDFFTSKAWREQHFGCVNYYDQTMRLGGYPEIKGTQGELFFSGEEERSARHLRSKFPGKFLVLWSLKGSSYHKVYPMLEPTLRDWLSAHPDAQIILTGSEHDKALQFAHPQVMPGCGVWPLREVFCLTKHVDLVVGPESAIINAASCSDVEKICLLSHSTAENLTKYWTNVQVLEPEDVACYPCNMLHYTLESCPLEPSPQGLLPKCAVSGVSPERLKAALDVVYNKWQASRNLP